MENRWIGQMDSNSLKRLVDDQFPLQSNKTSSMRDLLGSSQTGTSGNPSKKIIKSSTLDGMAPPMSIAGVQIHPKSSYFEFSPSPQKPANKIFNPSQGRSNTHNFSDVSGEDIFNAFEATENRNQSQDQNNIDLFSDNSNFQSNSKNNENLLYMSSFENQNPVSKRLNSKQDHILNNFIEFSDSNNDRTTQNNKNDGLFDQYEGNASKNDSFVSSNNLNRLNNKQNILMSNFANNDDNDISIFDDNTNNNFDNNEEWNQEVSLFDSVKPTSTSSSEKSIIENNRSDEIHLNILENREEGESLLHRMNEDFDERTENPENLAIDLKFPSDFLPRQTRIPAAEAKLGKMPIFGSPELEREHFNSLKSQEQSQNRFEFKNKLNDKEEKIGDIEIYTPEEENLTGNQSGFVFPESAIEFIAKMKESTDELHLSFSDEETEILRNKSKETQSTFQPSFDSFTPTFSEKEES
ncbi:hypothetical protein TRFO_41352 [Tritrichomonas foetus]|uniref:Uncharacterized protein n=1 Tax=Tritrichomonas foetus TaxID=1144522 RepID=A0A1J4L543_9EUKA|nr:hypothetical protein TRFO_41352 [Tritrichomonas foetus]|eukprot:OHT17053.1 hypothetical protein TRFO_41352 [Tritrichomonas foetus]